jgi:hypothetical protein
VVDCAVVAHRAQRSLRTRLDHVADSIRNDESALAAPAALWDLFSAVEEAPLPPGVSLGATRIQAKPGHFAEQFMNEAKALKPA